MVVADDSTKLADAADEALVSAYQADRCQHSLDELLRRHLPRVRSMALSMLLDDAVADDVTQDVFVRVVRGLVGFRQAALFSTWLYRIAWNVIQDAAARRPAVIGLTDDFGLEDVRSCERPTDELLRNELHQQIELALAKIAPSLRAAIVLTTLQGMSAQEAADLEGCPVGTMYWRMSEARRLLQERLRKYLDE